MGRYPTPATTLSHSLRNRSHTTHLVSLLLKDSKHFRHAIHVSVLSTTFLVGIQTLFQFKVCVAPMALFCWLDEDCSVAVETVGMHVFQFL